MLPHDLKEIDSIEPAWKLILGNKAILPLLWEMYPDHKNLLPAYFIDPHVQLAKNEENDKIDGIDEFKMSYKDLKIEKWISKPKFGREGHGVLFSNDFKTFPEFIKETEK